MLFATLAIIEMVKTNYEENTDFCRTFSLITTSSESPTPTCSIRVPKVHPRLSSMATPKTTETTQMDIETATIEVIHDEVSDIPL